jgi:hypothetical protein
VVPRQRDASQATVLLPRQHRSAVAHPRGRHLPATGKVRGAGLAASLPSGTGVHKRIWAAKQSAALATRRLFFLRNRALQWAAILCCGIIFEPKLKLLETPGRQVGWHCLLVSLPTKLDQYYTTGATTKHHRSPAETLLRHASPAVHEADHGGAAAELAVHRAVGEGLLCGDKGLGQRL